MLGGWLYSSMRSCSWHIKRSSSVSGKILQVTGCHQRDQVAGTVYTIQRPFSDLPLQPLHTLLPDSTTQRLCKPLLCRSSPVSPVIVAAASVPIGARTANTVLVSVPDIPAEETRGAQNCEVITDGIRSDVSKSSAGANIAQPKELQRQSQHYFGQFIRPLDPTS